MANAKNNTKGETKAKATAPSIPMPAPVLGEGKKVKRHGVEVMQFELANGDKLFTRIDLDPKYDRGRRSTR